MLPPHRQRFETTWWKLISSGAQLGDDLSGLSRLLNRLLPLRRASSTKANRRQLLGVFDDMDVRFDEPEGALNEMTNTQLRKRKPGFGRAKALFATQGQEARPSAITSAGMARFRLTGFNPDGSLHFRGDVVQELVGKGRAEIATKQQHSRKLLEKERKLRAGHTTIGETPTQAKEPQSDFAEDYTALRTRTLVHEHAGPSFRRQTPKGSGRRGSRKATASMASDSPVAGTSSEEPTSHANQSQAAPKSAALADDPLSPSAMFLHSVAKRAPEVSSSNKQVASLSQNIRHARASTGKFPQVGSIAQGRHAEPEAVVSLTRRIHEASTTEAILIIVAARANELDLDDALAAVTTLARLSPSVATRRRLVHDPRFADFLCKFEARYNTLAPREACALLSALARLKAMPPWIGKLLTHMSQNARAYDVRNASIALLATSRLHVLATTRAEAYGLVQSMCQSLRARQEAEVWKMAWLESASLCSALARLRIRDRALTGPAAASVSQHLVNDSSGTEFCDVAACLESLANLGAFDRALVLAVHGWLCGTVKPQDDVFSLCRVLARCPPEDRELIATACIRPRLLDICARPATLLGPPLRLIIMASQAGLCDDMVRQALAEALLAIGYGSLLSPQLRPHLGALAGVLSSGGTHDAVMDLLLAGAAASALELSQHELASTITAFANLGVQRHELWESFDKALLNVAAHLRFSEAAVLVQSLLYLQAPSWQVVERLVGTCQAKHGDASYQDGFTLLRCWSRLDEPIRSAYEALPLQLAFSIKEQATNLSLWHAAPEFIASALSWGALTADGAESAHVLSAGTVVAHAFLPFFHRVALGADIRLAQQVFVDLSMVQDPEFLRVVRPGLHTEWHVHAGLQDATVSMLAASMHSRPGETDTPASQLALAVGSMGLDSRAVRTWLGQCMTVVACPHHVAALCWACAELQMFASVVLDRGAKAAEDLLNSDSTYPASAESRMSLWRVVWALVASGAEGRTLRDLFLRAADVFACRPPPGYDASARVSASEARTLRQLFDYRHVLHLGEGAGDATAAVLPRPRGSVGNLSSSSDVSKQDPGGGINCRPDGAYGFCGAEPPRGSAADKLFAALQGLGVQHAAIGEGTHAVGMSSEDTVTLVGQSTAILLVAEHDRTLSGSLTGFAKLQHRLLEAAGWRVAALDAKKLMETTEEHQAHAVVASALVAATPREFAHLAVGGGAALTACAHTGEAAVPTHFGGDAGPVPLPQIVASRPTSRKWHRCPRRPIGEDKGAKEHAPSAHVQERHRDRTVVQRRTSWW